MTSFFILLFVLAILFGSMWLIQWANSMSKKEAQYPIVSAGSTDGTICMCNKMTDITNFKFVSNGKYVRIVDYIPYMVDGESMAASNIHTGDIVLAKDLFGDERIHLQCGNILVFTYTRDGDESKTVYYKLRQFIAYIENIEEDLDVDKWCEGHQIKEPEQFKRKYKKAKERANHDSVIYLCSSTWHENKLDYSFHSIVSLKARVYYCIPAEKVR